MIPKIIHVCWLSGEAYPDDIQKCIDSWKRIMPDYEIMLWDSNKFDAGICRYTKEAYQEKKWTYVSDYVRLYALYNYGGIYLDSDVEVLKSFDDLLNLKGFTGFEDDEHIAAWIFGSEKGNPIFKKLLHDYDNRRFILENGEYDLTPNPLPVTKCLLQNGLDIKKSSMIQELKDMTIFPMDYFCPFNPYRKSGDCFTKNTYCNHYFNGSWKYQDARKAVKVQTILRKYLGYHLATAIVFPYKVIGKIQRIGLKKLLLLLAERSNTSLNITKINLYFKMFYQFFLSYAGARNAVFLSSKATVDYILRERKSFIRYGDGEFDIMEGKGIHYQKFDKKLAAQLGKIVKEYITDEDVPYLIGMPGKYVEPSGKFMLKSRLLLSCWSHTRYYFNKECDAAVPYGDAFLFCKDGNSIYEKIWTKPSIKHLVFVHNNIKFANMFQEKYHIEVSFVRIPEKNAFDKIDIIYAEIKSKIKNGNEMVLVSAGPCGKILVYRLARKGIWAIDTGHCWDEPLKR